MTSTDSTGTQHETLLFAHLGILKRTYTLLLSSQPRAVFLAHKYTGNPRDLLAPIRFFTVYVFILLLNIFSFQLEEHWPPDAAAKGGRTADPKRNLLLSSSPSQL